MSNFPSSPQKRPTRSVNKSVQEDNNNTNNKFTDHQQARAFIQWFKHMIDNDRSNFTLYIADDAILEWFGRTIKSRKKVSTFLKYDMHCSKHDFITVESIEKLQWREESLQRTGNILESPLHSPELIRIPERCGKRKLRSNCSSPEWAEGCKPDDEDGKSTERKRFKRNAESVSDDQNFDEQHHCNARRLFHGNEASEIDNKGDGIVKNRLKRKLVPVTPPNREVGQGDCLPSTSGTDSNKSHEVLNAQLPKLAVQCDGYIEFTRTRNNKSADSMNWERKCKVQISYSEDPLNIGEYIIWALRYTDESKCRRNLLAAFEEVAKELEKV